MIYNVYNPRYWQILDLFPPPEAIKFFNTRDRMRLTGPDSDYFDFPDIF